MSCPHLSQLSSLQIPRLSQQVHREECTQCFDTQDLPQGIDVCLSCFNGGCVNDDPSRKHAQLHQEKLRHPFSLNIKRKLKPRNQRGDTEPPLKKVAILEEREEDKYGHEVALRCWICENYNGKLLPEASGEKEVKRLSSAVMQSMSSARKSEVKAWEEEILTCEHTLTLQQQVTGAIQTTELPQCRQCDLKDNLWLCLTCGNIGCGRQQFGGVSGNGHGLEHFHNTQHPVSVKLGTITPEGSADIYCYICNDSKLDPDLALHLSSFGINVASQKKTEKSMTELQIEQNLKFEFSLVGEDGKALEPVFGPGLTGLSNLGNSCYMASTLQTLFSLPSFHSQYLESFVQHARVCVEPLPADCVDCQMCKIADGLLSGRYSVPRAHATILPSPAEDYDRDPSSSPVFQEGVKPMMFKALIGKGHEEFSTMRQQDAEEFFGHLLKVLRRQNKKVGANGDATNVFKFGMQQRLQCTSCSRVRYRIDEHDDLSVSVPAREQGRTEEGKPIFEPVDLAACLDAVTDAEQLNYRCPKCDKDVVATKRVQFATFPEVLVIHAKKFQLVNWVPTKLDIPVNLPPENILVLDKHLATGPQPDEEILPDEADSKALPEFNAAALEQLQAMGFPLIRCQKALLATGNSDPEAAMEWLFAHMEDPDIDAPIVASPAAASGSRPEPSAEQVSLLADMGFTSAQARKALRETGGDAERAVEWLFSHPDDDGGEDGGVSGAPENPASSGGVGSASLPARYRLKAFISHKGPSVHSGHYVAHIKFDGNDRWVLFNDEKVVLADAESVAELKKLAYLYIFERIVV